MVPNDRITVEEPDRVRMPHPWLSVDKLAPDDLEQPIADRAGLGFESLVVVGDIGG